jgi:hypothetical protein
MNICFEQFSEGGGELKAPFSRRLVVDFYHGTFTALAECAICGHTYSCFIIDSNGKRTGTYICFVSDRAGCARQSDAARHKGRTKPDWYVLGAAEGPDRNRGDSLSAGFRNTEFSRHSRMDDCRQSLHRYDLRGQACPERVSRRRECINRAKWGVRLDVVFRHPARWELNGTGPGACHRPVPGSEERCLRHREWRRTRHPKLGAV